MQDGIELSLADDDMHLAADTGVGKQFLDVEQPTGVSIELVFAAAVAEHDPRNGDFGVVDGQRAVGIVDGEETSARPSGGRPVVPAKITSSILPPRSDFAPCSPMTQESASTTLDLPEPFGPTTQVMPGSNRSVVAEAKDLNPRRVMALRCTPPDSTFLTSPDGGFTAE